MRAGRLIPGPIVLVAVLGATAANSGRQEASPAAEDALRKRARAIHEPVMTLDTHNDIDPANFTPERNYIAGSRHPGQPAEDD